MACQNPRVALNRGGDKKCAGRRGSSGSTPESHVANATPRRRPSPRATSNSGQLTYAQLAPCANDSRIASTPRLWSKVCMACENTPHQGETWTGNIADRASATRHLHSTPTNQITRAVCHARPLRSVRVPRSEPEPWCRIQVPGEAAPSTSVMRGSERNVAARSGESSSAMDRTMAAAWL
jgi:hypothetical protein